MFSRSIIRPAECPSCRCEHWVVQDKPRMRSWRYGAGGREATGDVAVCAQCGYVATILRDGRVLGSARRPPAAPERPSGRAPAPGGTETGGPGVLDPDVWDPTRA